MLLIGADLRNPQIHKYLGIDKADKKGLSDYIYSDNLSHNDLIIKNDSLDILLSGAIPSNPSELLESEKFKFLFKELEKEYNYIIVDSAPCLLVSDSLQIAKYFELSLCVMRSNHTTKDVLNFLIDLKKENKLPNLRVVLNGVGASSAYGYQYGYKYGYKYGYNYGYGYGYDEDKN